MEDIDDFIRCYPFSTAHYVGHKQFCNKLSLIPVLTHIFKCQTFLLRKDAPEGKAPLFPGNLCGDQHFANNHILICLICQSKIFQGTWSKDKALAHISVCFVKSTYNLSKPYICTFCLQSLWLK